MTVAGFFHSGAVVIVGLIVLALEAVWLSRSVRHAHHWPQTRWFLAAGAALLLALGAALCDLAWVWVALALNAGLVLHIGYLASCTGRSGR